MNKNIVVIGSANMDTTNYLKGDFPEDLTSECQNEIAKPAVRVLGGKGANQAVSAKKQAGENNVYFIGCIGKDAAGIEIIEQLKNMNIDYSGVQVLDGKSTDGRIIFVAGNENHDNKMFGYGECVKELKPDILKTEKIDSIIRNADVVVIQMKMPAETVEYIVNYCSEKNIPLIIDPTPADKSPLLTKNGLDLLKKATYLTPNEEEAYALAQYIEGRTFTEAQASFKNASEEERREVIKNLVKAYPNVIATMGGKGVIYNRDREAIEKATYPTECKDTTGAGDTFNGALVASLVRGESLDSAIDFGLMASSMKVRHEGAQNGMPTYKETKIALDKAKENMK